MVKLFSIGLLLWLVIFTLRVISIGGIDPIYKEDGVGMFEPVRSQLSAVIENSLPYPQSALLSGILLGVQNKLPYFLKNDLKTTSTIHIVVVSGQNLTILAGFIMCLAPYLGRKKTIILTIFVTLLYSLMTGFGVPVMRAFIMVTLTYLAQLLGKEKIGWWVLLLTAGAMLLYQPHWLLNISFQLSFLATFGVVVVAPILIECLKSVPKILREDLGVTLSAQLLVLPVIAYNFNQISLVGLLVNSLVLWVVTPVMVLGSLVVLVGSMSSFLGMIIGLVPAILLTYFINLVELFAKLPGASLKIGQTGIVTWVGYYLIIFSLLMAVHKGTPRRTPRSALEQNML